MADTQIVIQPDWLARTKFYPPHASGEVLTRPRLLDALHAALSAHALTLVSAPAGYGKTTLLAQFVAGSADLQDGIPPSSTSNPQPSLRFAWLSLEEQDNDPTRFLLSVVAALRQQRPACGVATEALLHAPAAGNPLDRLRWAVGALINDLLDDPTPLVLCLDDLHLIDAPPIYLALDYWIERLPPHLRLVIATRYDPPLPLARLRVRGRLAELRVPDLRFTRDEAAAVLEAAGTAHAPVDLEAAYTRLEGWPAAVTLLAHSLRRSSAQRAPLLAHLAQTDAYVFDFLADEVLRDQEPGVRTFLLETSILNELTPALCQAVTGRADAGTMLHNLARRNLFLDPVEPASPIQPQSARSEPDCAPHSAQPVYRYHALFAQFLYRQLAHEQPERLRELHCRAAEAQTSPARAIEHYLAASLWDEAAALLERASNAWIEQGLGAALEGWLRALPPTLVEARPFLDVLLGTCALQKGELPRATFHLERAVARLEDSAALGEAWTYLVACRFLENDVPRTAEAIERALAYPLAPRTHVQVLMGRAWLHFYAQNWPAAQADVSAALDLAQRALVAAGPEASGVLTTLAFYLRSNFALLPGLLLPVEDFCRRSLVAFGDRPGPLQLGLYELSAFVHLWRGRLAEAASSAQAALDLQSRLGGYPFLGLDALACLAYTHVAAGNCAAAQPLLESVVAQLETQALGQADLLSACYLVGENAYRLGRLEDVRAAVARMDALTVGSSAPEAPTLQLALQGLLAASEHRYSAAESALREAATLAGQVPSVIFYSHPALLLAHLYLRWGRPQDALGALRPVLAQVERDACPGALLKAGSLAAPLLRLAQAYGLYPALAARLLALMGPGSTAGPALVHTTGATLTAREVEVLHLLAAGHSNREIAQALAISLATVKTHVAHLLDKLGAATRADAVARARTQHLVPDS